MEEWRAARGENRGSNVGHRHSLAVQFARCTNLQVGFNSPQFFVFPGLFLVSHDFASE